MPLASEKLSVLRECTDVPDINERATQILNAVDGMEICAAESLIKICAEILQHQKYNITSEFLESLKPESEF